MVGGGRLVVSGCGQVVDGLAGGWPKWLAEVVGRSQAVRLPGCFTDRPLHACVPAHLHAPQPACITSTLASACRQLSSALFCRPRCAEASSLSRWTSLAAVAAALRQSRTDGWPTACDDAHQRLSTRAGEERFICLSSASFQWGPTRVRPRPPWRCARPVHGGGASGCVCAGAAWARAGVGTRVRHVATSMPMSQPMSLIQRCMHPRNEAGSL